MALLPKIQCVKCPLKDDAFIRATDCAECDYKIKTNTSAYYIECAGHNRTRT